MLSTLHAFSMFCIHSAVWAFYIRENLMRPNLGMLNYVILKMWFLHSVSLNLQKNDRKDVHDELWCELECSFLFFPYELN